MINDHRWGYAMGAAWLAAIFFLGLHVQGMSASEKKMNPDGTHSPTMPISDPMLIEDRHKARKIVEAAAGLEDDYEYIEKRYQKIPPFTPPANLHLTPDNIKKLIGARKEYVRDYKHFKNKVVGKSPGLYRVIALVGMHEAYHFVLMKKSLTAHKITEEEFYWTADRLFEASLFCVENKFKNEQLEKKQRKHLKGIRTQLYKLTGVTQDLENGSILFDEGLLNAILARIPRRNIELFLDHCPDFEWHKIHFKTRIIKISFDRDAILAAAANNPP